MSFGNKIRKLDVFKKIPNELSEGTNLGGIISIFTAVSILTLISIQVYNFINPGYSTMLLPMRREFRNKMKINIDITFPRLPCEIVGIEQQDAVLSSNYEITSVRKFRIDQDGNELGEVETIDNLQRMPRDEIKYYDDIKATLENKHGCRMRGDFSVNEVPGIFRFTLEEHIQILGMLMTEGLLSQLDLSHRINSLSIGDPQQHKEVLKVHPNATVNQLQGFSKTFPKSELSQYMHYHLDIVPTVFRDRWNSISTYQYIYMTNTADNFQLPVLYFQYHIGGISLQVNCDGEVWWTFLINLCAVVGGTYAVASFLNNVLDKATGSSRKGYQLIQ